jgi:hypothetical protein
MGDRHIRRGPARAVSLLTGLAALASALLLGGAPPAPAYPPCFGAASRGLGRACHNDGLGMTVIPTPEEALIMPNSPCRPIVTTLTACSFAVQPERARSQAVLLGDSHAWQWRAALQVALDRLHWEGISLTRSSCPYTARMTHLPEPKRWECWEWTHAVPRWFAQHPEVSTVFVSDHPGAVARETGQSLVRAQMAGYIEAWRALPRTVKHIVLIRDTPKARENTLACVEAALSARQNAGLKCSLQRHNSLKVDPEVLAANQLHSRRVQVIDLTRFFCDWHRCYPVIGGALVFRDPDHITPVYAATLGPYLLHELGLLMRSWR